MKLIKKTICIFLTLLLILLAVFVTGRYGWRLLGFRACEGAGVQSVEVGDTAVRIKGFYTGSFPTGFCGYYAEEREGRLYVGFHFSAIFGIFETGDFNVTIPVKGEIREVILKTRLMERSLWTAEDGDAAEAEQCGIYVRLERSDVSSILLRGGSGEHISEERIDVLPLESGEWSFGGECIAQLAKETNRAILFTVSAMAADDTLLAEGAFRYELSNERLYVTIAEDGVTCSASDTVGTADVPPVLILPILGEIDRSVNIGTAGSSLQAVQAAASLLDWGEGTGLDTQEISEAASAWLAAFGGSDPQGFMRKLKMVDEMYQKLLTEEARELLDMAGCESREIVWSSAPVEPVEAIMRAAGLR